MNETNHGQVLCERQGEVGILTLSNPGKLNALSVLMWQQLRQQVLRLTQDDTLRAVLIKGADGNFAAGADISEFPEYRHDLTSVMHYHRKILAPALHALAVCPHPVIAQISGVCVGGGLEIAAQCDLRIAGHNARFGAPINKLGFPMAPEEMIGLLSLAGRAVATEILLEGRVFDAQEAWAKGLLTRLVEDDQLESSVWKSLDRITQSSPLAARLNKQMLRRLSAMPHALSQGEYRDFFSYAQSRDHQEGVRSFLKGTAPVFTGE